MLKYDKKELRKHLKEEHSRYITRNHASILQAIANLGGSAFAHEVQNELHNVDPAIFENTVYNEKTLLQDMNEERMRPTLLGALSRMATRELLFVAPAVYCDAKNRRRTSKRYFLTRSSAAVLAHVGRPIEKDVASSIPDSISYEV